MAIDLTPDFQRKRINLRVDGFSPARERFEYNGERWQVRFQSWSRKPQEGGALIRIMDSLPDDQIRGITMSTGPERLIRFQGERQIGLGWHLKLAAESIEGWFDLDRLPSEREKPRFVSFDMQNGAEIFRCQLFVERSPVQREAPIDRDWRRGASAGLPTLGKRR
jgi:hypothetical protein